MITAPTKQDPNLAYARRVFEALGNGNAARLDNALARNSMNDQLIEYFRMLREQTGRAYQLVPGAFAASGDKVLRLTIAGGKTVEVSNHVEVCRRRGS